MSNPIPPHEKIKERISRIYRSKLSTLKKKDGERMGQKSLALLFESEFGAPKDFVDWWIQQTRIQNNSCYYCETSLELIQWLIDNGLRTRNNRSQRDKRTNRSINGRGRQFELECKNPDLSYTKENCVLACMYCNNDKSDIFEADEYKRHFGINRKKYFLRLERNYRMRKNAE